MNTAHHTLRRTLQGALLALLALLLSTGTAGAAPIGTWRNFLAYHNITSICPAAEGIFALADGDLFHYRPTDGEVHTYDKTNGLSDCGIAYIGWSQTARRLIAVYTNGNIDLIDEKEQVTNLSDYYSKTMSADKTVNGLSIEGIHAYVSTGFGILDIDMSRAAVANTFNLGVGVNATLRRGDTFLAACADGVRTATTADNLLDRNAWRKISTEAYTWAERLGSTWIVMRNHMVAAIDLTTGATRQIATPWITTPVLIGDELFMLGGNNTCVISSELKARYIDHHFDAAALASTAADGTRTLWTGNTDGLLTTATYSPAEGTVTEAEGGVTADGPQHNHFGYTLFHDGHLYTTSGFFQSSQGRSPTIHILDGDRWTVYSSDFVSSLGHRFAEGAALTIDPRDGSHVMLATRTGLYEFRDGAMTHVFDIDNSPLQSVYGSDKDDATRKNYTYVDCATYDSQGTLWVFNGYSKTTSLMSYADGQWTQHHKTDFTDGHGESFIIARSMIIDSRGIIWFTNDHWYRPALACYQPSTDGSKVYDTFVNEDGKSVATQSVSCCAEDRDGNIWIGTTSGPLYLPAAQVGTDDDTFIQFKVPRGDGTNLADYLLDGIQITAIAVDGAGRKWFGTAGNGVYVISADNLVQEEHFTTDNSGLLSDDIESITIDGTSGEVYIGTGHGLCAYASEASDPNEKMTKDNVWAYPNPVRPDYEGYITVTGLTLDADVKIVTSNGTLVASGRSTGGSYLWDGRDTKGRRVASGVYMVETATASGEKGTVCKIAVIR